MTINFGASLKAVTPIDPITRVAQLGLYSDLVTPIARRVFERPLHHTRDEVRILIGATPIPDNEFVANPLHVNFTWDPNIPLRKIATAYRPVEPESADFVLWNLNDAGQRRMREYAVQALKLANRLNVDVVTLNEMAFPDSGAGLSTTGTSFTTGAEVFRHYFRELLRQQSIDWNDEARFYAMLGSVHCGDQFTNSTPIYEYKGGASTLSSGGRPLTDAEEEEIFEFEVYRKNTSAVAVDECIRIPWDRCLAAIPLGNLTLVPLVCLDLYDPSQLFSITQRNYQADSEPNGERNRIDVILVSSYGMKERYMDRVESMCARLSHLSASVVVFCGSDSAVETQKFYYLGDEVFPASSQSQLTGPRSYPHVQQVQDDYGRPFSLLVFSKRDFRDAALSSVRQSPRQAISEVVPQGSRFANLQRASRVGKWLRGARAGARATP